MKPTRTIIEVVTSAIENADTKNNIDTKASMTAVFRSLLRYPDANLVLNALVRLGWPRDRAHEVHVWLRFSQYTLSHFWRGVVLHLSGIKPSTSLLYNQKDIDMCIDCLSPEDFISLLSCINGQGIGLGNSTYRLSENEVHAITKQLQPYAVKCAKQYTFYVTKNDGSQDPTSSLIETAVRSILYYDGKNPEFVAGYAKRAMFNTAQALVRSTHAQSRSAVKKLPEFKCPHCAKTFDKKKAVSFEAVAKSLVEIQRKYDPKITSISQRGNPVYCPECIRINNYGVRLISIRGADSSVFVNREKRLDAPVGGEDSTTLSDRLSHRLAPAQDKAVMWKQYVNEIAKDMPAKELRLVDTLLNGSDEFDRWLKVNNIDIGERTKGTTNELQSRRLFELLCEYIGLDPEKTRVSMGHFMGVPVPFMIQCGPDADGVVTQDIVYAPSARAAVSHACKAYRYSNWKALQEDLGEIVVLQYTGRQINKKAASVLPLTGKNGHIIPLPDTTEKGMIHA